MSNEIENGTAEKLEFTPLVDKEYELLNKYFTHDFRKGYVKCKNYVLPELYSTFLDNIRQMDVRDDDVWIVSYPKTGTTWAQELIWCVANNVTLSSEVLQKRFPHLEMAGVYDTRTKHVDDFVIVDSIAQATRMPSPRFIKTHLPFELLPEQLRNSTKTKIIYTIRNPADVCVSYYHHSRSFLGYRGGFEDFCELFLQEQVPYAPFWGHVFGFWNRKPKSNLLILRYEDMKKDLSSCVRKVAKFLDKTLTQQQMEKLLNHLSFESMKANPAVNYKPQRNLVKKLNLTTEFVDHIRCGKVGEWKKILSPALCERFEKWTLYNTLNTDLKFDEEEE